MATSKTLTPTNVTIQIPAFTDQPDQRANSNCIDKEADAINALMDKFSGVKINTFAVSLPVTLNMPNGSYHALFVAGPYSNRGYGAGLAVVNSSGSVYPHVLDGSDVSMTAGTNTLTIANGSSTTATTVRILALTYAGNPPTVTT